MRLAARDWPRTTYPIDRERPAEPCSGLMRYPQFAGRRIPIVNFAIEFCGRAIRGA